MTNEEAIKWFRGSPVYHKDHEPYNMAIKALKKTKWIPVTEKEPTKGERVLMTLKNDEAYKEVVIGTMSMNLDGKFHIDDCGVLYAFDKSTVIAWMPLPEPYKEGE